MKLERLIYKEKKGVFWSRALVFGQVLFFILLLYPVVVALVGFGSVGAKIAESKQEIAEIKHIDSPVRLLEDLDDLSKKTERLKYTLQLFGQDFKLLQLLDRRSLLSNGERTVGSLSNTLTLTNTYLEALRNDIGSADLGMIREDLVEFLPLLKSSLGSLDKDLLSVRELLPEIELDLAKARSWIDLTTSVAKEELKWLTGEDGEKRRLLLVFQNNSELRGASGGSFGSFAYLDIEDRHAELTFGPNIYKIDNAYRQSDKEIIPPPEELKFVLQDRWVLKDSGWSVDGLEALNQMLLFHKIETDEELDGVITLDYSAFASLLDIIGPVEMPAYGKTITAKNFKTEVEMEVHVDYFKSDQNKEENEPKKILKEMIPLVLGRLAKAAGDDQSLAKITAALLKSIKGKDILVFFDHPRLEKLAEDLNWSGGIVPAFGDYLYIANSNIDGFKSSLSVAETLDLTVKINKAGETDNTLEIKREHRGSEVWPDGLNKNFVRLVLPESTQLSDFKAEKGNFEQFYTKGHKDGQTNWLTKGYGKKIVNFWMSTEPKEESLAKITYKTGYKLNTSDSFVYEIIFQKQPGAPPEQINFTLQYPSGFRPKNIENYDERLSQLSESFVLDSDRTIKIFFEKVKLKRIIKAS